MYGMKWLKYLVFVGAIALIFQSTLNFNEIVFADEVLKIETSAAPDDATVLFYHDFLDANQRIGANYVQYKGGAISKVGNVLAYRGNEDQVETNGVKVNVTDYVKMGSSGDRFGGALRLYVKDWNTEENRNNKATLFFEIVSEDGETKTQVYLSEIAPNADGSNLTDSSYSEGENWLKPLLKGEAVLKFQETDKIYLCCNQANQVQKYDDVSLWGDVDFYENPVEAVITRPILNEDGKEAEFYVTNLTDTEKNIIATVKHKDSAGKVIGMDEYQMKLDQGTETLKVNIKAQMGDVIEIKDVNGHTYVDSYSIGTLEWVGTWASSQLIAANETLPPEPGLANNTYRQFVRVSNGGAQLRITFSNEFGSQPLEIKSAFLARVIEDGNPSVKSGTNKSITFDGIDGVTIPPKGKVTSDIIDYKVEDLEKIAISTYFGEVPVTITSHTASRSNNFLIPGNHAADAYMSTSTLATSWYFLSEIDVLVEPKCASIVCFGDSITDGYGVVTDSYGRWTDILAERLKANESTTHLSVLNQGIGGNAIFGGNGVAARERFERDVINMPGVKYVIILIGINDIGFAGDDVTDTLIKEYASWIEKAHEHGIKVYAGTILPFKGNSYYSVNEGQLRDTIRENINNWMRSAESGFDGVIDFSADFASENDKSTMNQKYVNDYLHPNPDGYIRMGEFIDLSLFE